MFNILASPPRGADLLQRPSLAEFKPSGRRHTSIELPHQAIIISRDAGQFLHPTAFFAHAFWMM
jgi:hypothetical protein